jgi:O-antigen/teichoic acid export membrane protein
MRRFSSLIDQVLVSGGNFLTTIICARTLPLSEQGKIIYIFSSYMALLLLNVAGIFQGASVLAPSQDRYIYKISIARLQLLQSLFLSLIISCCWYWAGGIFEWKATNTESTLLLGFLILQQLADFDRRAAYIFSSTKRAIFSSSLIYPIRVFALLIVQPSTAEIILLILLLSSLLPATLTLYTAMKYIDISFQSWFALIKYHLSYSLLFIASAPLGWLWAYIPIFMLGIANGKEQAALLASIRGISNIANILMEQIETKIAADWARLQHKNNLPLLLKSAAHLINIGIISWLCGILIIFIYGKEIVYLLLGPLYATHWNLLAIAWGGYGIYFIARILAIRDRAQGNNKIEFFGNITGVSTAIIAGILIIPKYEILGAAFIYVIISIAMLISQLFFGKNIIKK